MWWMKAYKTVEGVVGSKHGVLAAPDLEGSQTLASVTKRRTILIGLVLRRHSAGEAKRRTAVRLRRSSCLLVLLDTLRVRHIRLAMSLLRRDHDFLCFLSKLIKLGGVG